MFNVSIGLDLDDTGIDNIYTTGMYLGMKKKEIEAKKDEIIAFSDLGDYVHLPVRTYSAGMRMCLSFAIATATNPEILLMDEDLSAGDAGFAEKANDRLKAFYSKMSILVTASHSDDRIRRLCNKALLLEHGKLKAFGKVDDVLHAYHELRGTSQK